MTDWKTYMPTSLRGIANRSRREPGARFGDLYRLLNEENLRECYGELRKSAAPGVDRVTVGEYGENLGGNLKGLVERLKKGTYRAKLVRRKHIPKGNGKTRPLGIPVVEDKLLQLAVKKILEAVFEPVFLQVSWGYRPGRSAREASQALAAILGTGKYRWVVEADIRSYFDTINHKWLMVMLEEKIGDRALLRLIGKWLKAGILEEDGKVTDPVTGTPQGGVISPILANLYLHHALDKWFLGEVRMNTRGNAMMLRYADDFVAAFEYEEDAKRFLAAMPERLAKGGLDIAWEKTRMVRFAKEDPGKENEGFDFLGFRYVWRESRGGKRLVQRITSPKKRQASEKAMRGWIKENRHLRARELFAKLSRKLRGYWNYYGVSGNYQKLSVFWQAVKKALYQWLNRRSQRKSVTWSKLLALLKRYKVPWPRVNDNRQTEMRYC
jgi:RNA-directed DNA polymerase